MEGKLNDLSSVLALKDDKVQSLEVEIAGLNQRIRGMMEDLDRAKGQIYGKNESDLGGATLGVNEESKGNVQELETCLQRSKKQVAELEKSLKLKEIKIRALDGEKRKAEEEVKDVEILMQQIRAENFDLHRRLNERNYEIDDD